MHHSVGTPALWLGFSVAVLTLLVLDLLVFHRREHEVRMREALAWSAAWIALALAFNFRRLSALRSGQGGRVPDRLPDREGAVRRQPVRVRRSSSSYFGVPAALQHRVLFWGIIGALVLRGAFIALGAALLETLPLGDLRVRRLPDLHRHQDAVSARRGGRTRSRIRWCAFFGAWCRW